mgnify:CR=1 FL=1
MKNLFKSVSTLLLLCCLVSSISTQVFASTNSYNTNVEDDSIDTKASFFISGIGEDSKGEFIFVMTLMMFVIKHIYIQTMLVIIT